MTIERFYCFVPSQIVRKYGIVPIRNRLFNISYTRCQVYKLISQYMGQIIIKVKPKKLHKFMALLPKKSGTEKQENSSLSNRGELFAVI